MPTLQQISTWITTPVKPGYGLYVSVFVEENKPSMDILCINPTDGDFANYVINHVLSISRLSSSRQKLKEAIVLGRAITVNCVIIGLLSTAKAGERSSVTMKELRKKQIRKYLFQNGFSNPWVDDYEASAICTEMRIEISISNGQILCFTPLNKFAYYCESERDIKAILDNVTKENISFLSGSANNRQRQGLYDHYSDEEIEDETIQELPGSNESSESVAEDALNVQDSQEVTEPRVEEVGPRTANTKVSTKPSGKSVAKPAARKVVAKPTSKTTSKPGAKLVARPVAKPAAKDSKATAKVAVKPVKKITATKGGKPGDPELDLEDEEDIDVEVLTTEADIDVIVAEVEEVVPEVEEDNDAIVVPEGALILSSKEDDIPSKSSQLTGATADPVKDYLRQIGHISLLSEELEIELAKRIEAGLFAEERIATDKKLSRDMARDLKWVVKDGQRAKSHLLEANLRLVVSLAKRYTGRGMQFLDLIQEGNLGLIRAVEKFDFTKGYKFSTYATWWIRQAITRAMADQARTIRIPVHMVEVINKLSRVQRQLLQDLGREPTPEELARELDMTPEKVVEVQKYGREPISIDIPWGEQDEVLGDYLVDDGTEAVQPADSVVFKIMQRELERLLYTLRPREAAVIRSRYGIGDGVMKTLDQIADEHGVTRERIRQIEAKTMSLLKHPSRAQWLRDFIKDD